MKILHTSDIHLGVKLGFLGTKAKEHRAQVSKTLLKIADLAKEQKVSLVVVAGDIFDSPFPSEQSQIIFQEFLKALEKYEIYCVVMPGNHDKLVEGSVFARNDLIPKDATRLKIFSGQKLEMYYIEALNVAVHSIPASIITSGKFATEQKANIHIGITHGSIDIASNAGVDMIKKEKIEKLPLDYLALGDWHSVLEVSKKPVAYYSGSPELININQTGAGHVLVFDTEKKAVEKLAVGTKIATEIKVDISNYVNNKEIIDYVSKNSDQNIFAKIILEGTRSLELRLDLDLIRDALSTVFYYFRIKDKSILALDEEKLADFPEEFISGRFIRILRSKKNGDPEQDKLIDQAIQLGLQMLNKQNDL